MCIRDRSISSKFANKYYEEVTVGLDLTARDLQEVCKRNGYPWEIAKAFDYSAPIGQWHFKDSLISQDFYLLKNGKKVQVGNPNQMIFDIDTIIAYVSKFITLKKGDLIYTGTPSGVGKIESGDKFLGYLDGKKCLDLRVK